MKPVVLRSDRLVLDQPTLDDVDDITGYCEDPVFEEFATTSWPYERHHAEGFLDTYVPGGWRKDAEYTWAIRESGTFVGVIGFRTKDRDVGFWLGAPYRGHGIMPQALGVARKAGFTYRGRGEGLVASRAGGHPLVEKATIAKSVNRAPKPGWPELRL